MRNTLLSLVVVAALIAGAVGGTLATWSDSETSYDNQIHTGSVDLLVNGADDLPWGTGVPSKVNITCMAPCKWYGPFEVVLWNAGQCEDNSSAYIHVKNITCFNIPPKPGSGYDDPPDRPAGEDYVPLGKDGNPCLGKTEPELVAEYGGIVCCGKEVKGIGPEGDECSMGTHVMMVISNNATAPPPEQSADDIIAQDKLGKWDCKEIYLFDLEPCVPRTIYLWFHLQQDDEDAYDDVIPDPGEPGYDEMLWMKFNDWPSWALMKDGVKFDIEFDLVLWDC
jgi:predicted ribosomally synthesized peptide with SipW-like signal peptide